ncbi:MAG: deoxyribodipyrimidine photo-lyase [Lentimicrobium sp.]
MTDPINIFWFRRDLRFNDNRGLYEALKSGRRVLPLFIFDTEILSKLPIDDSRVTFIFNRINWLNEHLSPFGSRIDIRIGKPVEVFRALSDKLNIEMVFTNRDYEPYAITRDKEVADELEKSGTGFETFKDQVLFEADEILKPDGKPYVVFTPYSKKWLERLNADGVVQFDSESGLNKLIALPGSEMPSLQEIGFKTGRFSAPGDIIRKELIESYAETRNFPGLGSTSRLGLHLRFGTISVRDCIIAGRKSSTVWLNELIWREFFMQILANFPHVEKSGFRNEYDRIQWLNDEDLFEKWCKGLTGYPLVDAGMRELSQTGFMHNRVRMVVASFLVKHLLIDWRWGEAWFAEKLLDFELSSNNGNWQWAAGSGCDAAPYFRIFNPAEQARKFDPQSVYIRKWVPEYGTPAYPQPVVEHTEARKRCLSAYQSALKG